MTADSRLLASIQVGKQLGDELLAAALGPCAGERLRGADGDGGKNVRYGALLEVAEQRYFMSEHALRCGVLPVVPAGRDDGDGSGSGNGEVGWVGSHARDGRSCTITPLVPFDVLPLHEGLRIDWRCDWCVHRMRLLIDRVGAGSWLVPWSPWPGGPGYFRRMDWLVRRATHFGVAPVEPLGGKAGVA